MRTNTFFCDHCQNDKFDSETQTYIPKPFSCYSKAHWMQHINTKKHILNEAYINTLEADLVVECKHCSQIFTKEQYKIHSNNNSLLWTMKTNDNIYRYSSCNHFIDDNGKRFANIKIMKEYVEGLSRYQKELKKKERLRQQLHKILDNDEMKEQLLTERRLKNREKIKAEFDLKEAKKAKKQAEEEEQKSKKVLKEANKKAIPKGLGEKWAYEYENTDENLELVINPVLEEFGDVDCLPEYESAVEKAQRERRDFDIPPDIDPDDLCEDCGYTRNEYLVYPEDKLKRYGYSLCSCEETDDED